MADAGEAIGLRIFGKLDAGCSSSDTKQEMPDMIWNDHRLIDVGNHIALAAMVDLITSVHFELQDGFLSSDGVGDAFGRGGSRVWHFRLWYPVGRGCSHRCDCSTASIFGGRVGEQPSHVVEPSSLFGLRCRIKEVDPIMLLDEQRIALLLAATAVDLEANGGLQLAKVRAALSLLVDLKQAGEAVE